MAYVGPINDPFGVPAPDGNTYFKVLGPPPGMIDTFGVLAAEQSALRRRTDPYGIAMLVQVTNILRTFRAELDVVARQIATTASANVVRHIKATAVRPAQGRSRPKRLQDAIVSRPIHTPLPMAMVGIGDISELDQVVGPDGKPYWRAQEFGSDHLVGARVIGAFMPGGARPDPAQYRQHAEFVVGGKVAGTNKPALMIVRNPIEERAFLRQGVEDAAIVRRSRLNAVKGGLMAQMRAAATGAAPAEARAAFRAGRGKLGR